MPLDLFITPFTSPKDLPSSRTGWDSIYQGSLDRREEAIKHKQLDQDMEKHRGSLGVQKEEVRGKNAYYQDSVDARREASRNALEGKREARVSNLLTQMRKSASLNKWDEVDMIRQELTRLGYAVEEGDTAFEPPPEETAAAALGPDVPVAKTPAVKGPKVPKVDPGFAGALSEFMRTENDKPPAEGGEPAEDPQASPFPWEANGMEAPKKKKRGGRFTVKDREGNLVQVMDEPMEKEKDRSSIEEALQPFLDDPQSPEQQGAARRASAMAQKAISTGMSPDKALQMGRDQLNKEMTRFKTQKLPSAAPPAGIGGVGGGGSKLGSSKAEVARLGAMDDNQTQFLFKLSQDHKIPEARKAVADIDNMERGLEKAHEDGFSGGAALSAYMKAISGATVNEGEVDRIMGGAGALSQWETKLNRYANGGKLDDDLIRGLKGVAQRARQVFDSRIQNVVQTGQGWFRNNPGLATPEDRIKQQGLVKGFFTGKYDDDAPAKGPASGKPGLSLEEKMKARGL